MKSIILLVICLVSLDVSSQIVRGGIEKSQDEPAKVERRGRPGLKIIIEIENQINGLKITLKNRRFKCIGIKSSFKNLSDVMTYLNYQAVNNEESIDEAKACGSKKTQICLLNKNVKKQLEEIFSNKFLDAYLEEYERLDQKEIETLRQIYESIKE